MLHVDEGLLAAYLDGELAGEAGAAEGIEGHLATCPECQARFVEARRQRERARAILRGPGAPGASMPPFADIVSRARTRDAERLDKRRISRLASLAWAATIVVAVGVGWYARQQSLLRVVQVPGALSEKAAESVAGQNQVEAQASPAEAGAKEERPPLPAAPRRESPADKKEAVFAQQSPATQNVAKSPVPPAGPAPTLGDGAATRGKLADRRDQDKADSSQARELLAAPTELDAIVVTEQAGGARRRGVEEGGVGRFSAETSLRNLTEWKETTEAAAAKLLGRTPYRVPDIPVSAYAVRSIGQPAIQITQPLGPGQVLRITQERDAGSVLAKDRAANEPLNAASRMTRGAASASLMTIGLDGYRITGQASISRDSLAALLGKLR